VKRRLSDDLLLRGEANAKANGREVVQPFDLPITKGPQESSHASFATGGRGL
jgi:hypothetical protein